MSLAASYCTGSIGIPPITTAFYFSFGRDYVIDNTWYSACENASVGTTAFTNTDLDYDTLWNVYKPYNTSVDIGLESNYDNEPSNDLSDINCQDEDIIYQSVGYGFPNTNVPSGTYWKYCYRFTNMTVIGKVAGEETVRTGSSTTNGSSTCYSGGGDVYLRAGWGGQGWTNATYQIPEGAYDYRIYYRDSGTLVNNTFVYLNGVNTLNLTDVAACTLTAWQTASAGDNITIEHRTVGANTELVRIEYLTNITRYGAMKLINVSSVNEIKFYYIIFEEDYFSIANVDHVPTYPSPNSTVTVTWETTLNATSRIFFRSIPYSGNKSNETQYSAWGSFNESAEVLTHSVEIQNDYILDGHFYQYFVESNRSGTVINDTNGGSYYNFSVGGWGAGIYEGDIAGRPWENDTLRPANPIADGASRMSELLELDTTTIYTAIFFLMLMLMAGATFWFTNNIAVGGGVFLVGATLFSLFTYMPYFVFIIVGLIFAFIMVYIFRELFS